ncbi:hypothetical protein KSP40_PGU010764 [Platanthera guangdongensis]|uniref:Uncharacterized protein n=1 Tax=Platanthera guangdongensis TaxID=2320717 RepID=A0ABR2M5P8_9ASPA
MAFGEEEGLRAFLRSGVGLRETVNFANGEMAADGFRVKMYCLFANGEIGRTYFAICSPRSNASRCATKTPTLPARLPCHQRPVLYARKPPPAADDITGLPQRSHRRSGSGLLNPYASLTDFTSDNLSPTNTNSEQTEILPMNMTTTNIALHEPPQQMLSTTTTTHNPHMSPPLCNIARNCYPNPHRPPSSLSDGPQLSGVEARHHASASSVVTTVAGSRKGRSRTSLLLPPPTAKNHIGQPLRARSSSADLLSVQESSSSTFSPPPQTTDLQLLPAPLQRRYRDTSIR